MAPKAELPIEVVVRITIETKGMDLTSYIEPVIGAVWSNSPSQPQSTWVVHLVPAKIALKVGGIFLNCRGKEKSSKVAAHRNKT